MYEIRDYLTPDGHDPYIEWLSALADRMAKARARRIAKRTERVRIGLPADLTTEERIGELSDWLTTHEHYSQAGGLACRLYGAKRRILNC